MIKKTNDNADVTANSKQLEILKKEFPQCFDKNGGFIAEKLHDIVSDSGAGFSKESYSLNWLGKSYARLLANENPRTLLSADTTHNAKAEHKNSENLLIKGDNLEVLKHLVHAYSEQVKMIYIDPPYNTGSDGFVYQDDRKFTYQQLSQLAGIDNDEAKRILNFTQSKANSHSAWLTFMYPRLYVARELLRDDGVIFISIDDNEVAQLKILCNEVFGENNFLGSIVWKNVTDNNPSNIAIEHEYILVFSKLKGNIEAVWKTGLSYIKDALISIGDDFIQNSTNQNELQKKYSEWFKDNKHQLETLDRYKFIDKGGVYTGSQSVHNPGKEGYRYDVIHPITKEACQEPLMGYRFAKSTMDDLIEKEKILYGKDHNKIIELKVYAKDYKDKISSVLELDGRLGANELRALFPEMKKVFTNPKPVELIKKLISYSSGESDLLLDFFSGSGTTAHAVMQLNAEDGGHRHCISVQIDEATDPKKEASKKYKTIFDITKARIEKAAEKIKAEYPDYKGDLGFKLFETKAIADSYLDDMTVLSAKQPDLPIISTNTDDVLTTWSIYDGITLTQSLVDVDLAGYIAQQHNKICYFMDEGFSNSALVAFLHKLDDTSNDFEIEKVVVYGPHFDSKHQREISESLSQYQNRKDKKLSIEFRY